MIVFWILVAVLGLSVYFFPVALASHRKCKATAGIAVVNIFLGWTFIGWVVALAWAACGEPKPTIPLLIPGLKPWGFVEPPHPPQSPR